MRHKHPRQTTAALIGWKPTNGESKQNRLYGLLLHFRSFVSLPLEWFLMGFLT